MGCVVQYLAGFLERSRIRTGRPLPKWEEGTGPLGVPPRCSANASLGVFDKLTLCTLSVELSLSNTRSAALQLSVGVADVFAGVPSSWANEKRKRRAETAVNFRGFIQLAKHIVIPPLFPSPRLFFGRERTTQARHCLLLRKMSTILIQRLKLCGPKNDAESFRLTFCLSYTATLVA